MAVNKEELLSESVADRLAGVTLTETSTEREKVSIPESSTNTDTSGNSRPNDIIADDPFSSEKSKLLFEAIDRLRDCGAGQDLELPQLVIVGKQSAGKSSLLRSLTDIPFSVGDDLCTRFATRIISKRTAPGTDSLIKVSIEQGDINPFGEDTELTSTFNPSYSSLTVEEFKMIVEKASESMGLSSKRKQTKKNFSSKVLKIELLGPNRSHFGILDLPGIIGAAINGVREEELSGVTEMVTAYMKKPQNIIICVAVADDDLANQSILRLASQHVDNDRIVGVFTKCDIAPHKAKKIVEIVKKSEGTSGKALHHGWYVVRNKGPEDHAQSFDREKAETLLFNGDPWNQIEKDRRGTAMLKKFLSRLLCERIHDGFPSMQDAVQKMLKKEEARLAAMGPPRPTHESQLEYLADIARRFQRLAEQALNSPTDLPSNQMKFRGKLQRYKTNFGASMTTSGHLYPFVDINTDKTGPDEDTSLYDEIRAQIEENRGVELEGMINPAILKPLFKIQATKWQNLAKEHLRELADTTMKAMELILDQVCKEKNPPRRTRDELQDILKEFGRNAWEKVDNELDVIWEQEFRFQQTTNPAFRRNVEDSRRQRFSAAVVRYAKRVPPEMFLAELVGCPKIPPPAWAIINQESVTTLFEELHPKTRSNTEDEIHDLLKAYYEVAREDFISNVNKRCAEPYLHDRDGPVLGLCSEYVYKLSHDMVELLGGEDVNIKKDRKNVEGTIERLRAANRIAKETLRRADDIPD